MPTDFPNSVRIEYWLTRRRLFSHAILLAVCAWSVLAIDFATPGALDRGGHIKFQDFLPFYTAGRFIEQGRADELYDVEAAARDMQKVMPESARVHLPFVYGPQVACLFAPLARLPFLPAALVWSLFMIGAYGLSCYALWRGSPDLQSFPGLVAAAACAFLPFVLMVAGGQNSSLALACFSLAYVALQRNRAVLAGFALGCVVFKPSLGIPIAVVLIAGFAWRILLGAVLAVASQAAIAWMCAGAQALHAYARMAEGIGHLVPVLEPGLADAHSLRSFWLVLLPFPRLDFWLYVVSSLVVLAIAVTAWRGQGPLPLRCAILTLAAILTSPHLYAHDLVLLAAVFIPVANWNRTNPDTILDLRVRILLYCLYILCLIGITARWTHVQLTVPVMVLLLWTLSRVGNTAENGQKPL
jgi:hypothetical protein